VAYYFWATLYVSKAVRKYTKRAPKPTYVRFDINGCSENAKN